MSVLVRSAIVISIISGLAILGNVMNDFFFVQWMTNFFILLRTVVRPLEFIWDFQTSFVLVGLSLSIFMAYYGFKAVITIKNLLTKTD